MRALASWVRDQPRPVVKLLGGSLNNVFISKSQPEYEYDDPGKRFSILRVWTIRVDKFPTKVVPAEVLPACSQSKGQKK